MGIGNDSKKGCYLDRFKIQTFSLQIMAKADNLNVYKVDDRLALNLFADQRTKYLPQLKMLKNET